MRIRSMYRKGRGRTALHELQVLFAFALTTMLAGGEPARSATAQRLSIREALQLAPRASESLKRARAVQQSREGEARAARSGYFPQASASASYERTLRSEFDDVFDTPPGTNMAGQAFEDLPFGRANTYRLGISVNQNLYAGGRTRAESRLARAAVGAATIGVSSARARAILDAASAYYDAVLADRFVAIAEATLTQAEQTLADVRIGFEAGTRPEFDFLRARVAVELQRPVLIRQRTARTMAHLRLAQILDLPVAQPLDLVSTLNGEELVPLAEQARQVFGGPKPGVERAPVRQALEAVRGQEAAVSAANAAYLPSVDLYMTYGRVAYPDDLVPAWSDFRTNWLVGLSVTLTLFDGFRTSGNVRAAEGARADALLALKEAREAAAYEFVQAEHELAAARAVWEATQSSTGESERAYTIARLRYEEGVSTQLELSDARLRLQQAQAERAQAARDLQVARIRVALLPALPFAGMPASGSVPQAVTSGGSSPTGAPGSNAGSAASRPSTGAQSAGTTPASAAGVP